VRRAGWRAARAAAGGDEGASGALVGCGVWWVRVVVVRERAEGEREKEEAEEAEEAAEGMVACARASGRPPFARSFPPVGFFPPGAALARAASQPASQPVVVVVVVGAPSPPLHAAC